MCLVYSKSESNIFYERSNYIAAYYKVKLSPFSNQRENVCIQAGDLTRHNKEVENQDSKIVCTLHFHAL